MMNDGLDAMTSRVVRIAALALFVGMLCAWPLWDVGERPFQFPLLPLFGGAHFAAPVPGHWQALSLAALTALLAFLPSNRWLLALTLTALALLCLLDLNRLQPWVWLYGLIFVAALQTLNTQHLTLQSLRLLLAAVYFWSGFHKLTPYFAEDNFAWFCEAFRFTQPLGQYPALGYAVALLEMSFAAGLMWPRTRRWFRYLVIGLHAVILAVLSPWGHDWNAVVWPWNLAMAALVWFVFSEKHSPEVAESRPVMPERGLPGYIVIALAWLGPLLNIWGLWPHALSWQLYTNTHPEATFYTEQRMVFKNPNGSDVWPEFTKGEPELYLEDWAMRDLRVPIFASERTFRQMGKYLCGCLSQPDSAALYILSVRRWDKSAVQDKKIPCRELRMEN